MLKNISTNECFGVFSKAIAFAGVESRFAAARTICPQRRRAHPAATWARTQGGTSATEVARPLFRRQITEGPELSRQRQRHSVDREKGTIVLESTLQADSSCKSDRNPASMPRIGTAGRLPVELVHANGFLPDLIFRQVRARPNSIRNTGKRHCQSEIPTSGIVSVAAPETHSQPPQWTLRSRRSGMIAQTESSGPAPSPLERLLAELVCRRLRSLAAGRES
jgi:hypothetical protein